MQVIRLVMVLMLSLSLSAQAFAGALLPCQMTMQSTVHGHQQRTMSVSAMEPSDMMAHHGAMDHSNMSANTIQTEKMDCCLQECKCPKAACASLALITSPLIKLGRSISPRLLPSSVELPRNHLNKLIRPPISA